MSNNPWGDNCYTCGARTKETDYGFLGPLNHIQEQRMICSDCVNQIRKFRNKN